MRRTAALGLVAVVFAVGLVAGVLGGRLLSGTSPEPRDFGPPPFQRYFTRGDLDLTSEQKRQVEAVFGRQRAKFEALHSDLRPQVEALMDQTQAQIEAILTPEQLERFRLRRNRWHHQRLRQDQDRKEMRRPRRYPEAQPPPGDPRPPTDPL